MANYIPCSRNSADPIGDADTQARALAFEIIATTGQDKRAVLSRIQTLAVRIDGIADDAFAAERRGAK